MILIVGGPLLVLVSFVGGILNIKFPTTDGDGHRQDFWIEIRHKLAAAGIYLGFALLIVGVAIDGFQTVFMK